MDWTKVTDIHFPDKETKKEIVPINPPITDYVDAIYGGVCDLKEKALKIITEALPVLLKDPGAVTVLLHEPIHPMYNYSVEYRGVQVARFLIEVMEDGLNTQIRITRFYICEDNSKLEEMQ